MLGYIYKTINNITGQFYIGHRHYDHDKHLINNEYLGSSKFLKQNIEQYGLENFSKIIIAEADTEEDLLELEAYFIKKYKDNPKLINSQFGTKWGGKNYIIGKCKKCKIKQKLYRNGTLCMKCILQEHNDSAYYYCNACKEKTYHYASGKCKSCASKEAHNIKWCNVCQNNTTHMGNNCKEHYLKLHKTKDGKVQLIVSTRSNKVMFQDISFIFNTNKIETPKSVCYQLPKKNGLKIASGDKLVGLEAVLYNKNVSNWLKITYKYDYRNDHKRSIILTTDHPLPLYQTNKVVKAKQLKIGDKLVRLNTDFNNQLPYAEIINIEPYDYVGKSYDVTTENHYFNINNDIYSHNCRSFLQPYYRRTELTDFDMPCRLDSTKEWKTLKDIKPTDRFNNGYKVVKIQIDKVIVDEPVTWGRFNQGVVTLNLPYVALDSKRLNEDFYVTLDRYLEICRKALLIRHESVKKIKPKIAPMLWMWGAYLNLGPEDSLEEYLTNKDNGYTSISLGYVGLYETVRALIGESNTSKKGEKLAYEILTHINEKLAEWKKEDNLPYSIYGTPEETTTDKFAQALKREFGNIKYVTDHDYVTNSYHVNPAENIDAFHKLKFESMFLDKSTGGAVSYIEVNPNIKNNIDAVISLIKYMYNTILYSEINTKLDYCYVCNSHEELDLIKNADNKLIFKCKICGNTDQTKMSGIRRLCGYIGEVAHGISPTSPASNQGRLSDVHDRVVHL